MCLFANEPRSRRSGAFIAVSMCCLACANLWPSTSFSHALTPNLRDFFKGLLYGLSFAFSIGALILARRSRLNRS